MILSEFLLARIIEDQSAAERAAWDGHTWIPVPCHVARADTDVCVTTFPTDAAHIARWDPPRVMTDCEAKCEMVVICQSSIDEHFADGFTPEDQFRTAESARLAKQILARLALSYQGHPDYQNEWKP